MTTSGSARVCKGCGHDPACGQASIMDKDGKDWYCHDDDHSCYTEFVHSQSPSLAKYLGELREELKGGRR